MYTVLLWTGYVAGYLFLSYLSFAVYVYLTGKPDGRGSYTLSNKGDNFPLLLLVLSLTFPISLPGYTIARLFFKFCSSLPAAEDLAYKLAVTITKVRMLVSIPLTNFAAKVENKLRKSA